MTNIYEDIVGANSSTYSFIPTFPEDASCSYQVMVQDINGCSVLSSMASLTEETDCSLTCHPSLEGLDQLTGTQSTSTDYETASGIDSDQLISNGVQIDYDATTDIDLLPGFEVQLGAEFDAFIDGCNNGSGGNQ